MASVPYTFVDGERVFNKDIEVTEGDTTKPVIVLLHGAHGTRSERKFPAHQRYVDERSMIDFVARRQVRHHHSRIAQ